jgi:hypothetical protein
MTKLLFVCAVFSLSVTASDTEPLTGTWRINLSKARPSNKPIQLEIGHGMYRCVTCDPKVEIQADGEDHPVTGQSYDTLNAKIVDDKVVESTAKKNGKITSKTKITVSPDGKTYLFEYTGYPPEGSEPITSKVTMKRVGKPERGMHAASGSWIIQKEDEVSENAKEFSYEQTADGLSEKDSTGFGYSAKFDGKDYPVKGSNSFDAVVVKKIGPRTVEETFKYQGKVTETNRMTVSADGKSMSIQWKESSGLSGIDYADRK